MNQVYTQMPISAGESVGPAPRGSRPSQPTEALSPVSTANVTLFRPSTFFIIAQTNLGLQLSIQLVPIMQVFVRLGPELRGLTCGKRRRLPWEPGPTLSGQGSRGLMLALPPRPVRELQPEPGR